MPKKAIARDVGVCPKTVRRVLRKGSTARPKKRRPSKLDPYRAVIRYKALVEGWRVREIFKEIVALGYQGGESILKDYVREIRPKARRRPALRFETGPAVQGQIDLSPYEVVLGGVPTTLVCFSFLLAWSRWRYFHFVRHADHFTVMLCHRLAFEELGGLPNAILYDQMKQVVIVVVDGEPLLQDDFARLVDHYGFEIRVLDAGYKEGKGKVERPFQEVEAFLRHRTFHNLDDLNDQAWRWRKEELHARPHRTTGDAPADRLIQEQPRLHPLPIEPFRCEERGRAYTGKHFHVEYLGAFYSVPPEYADQWVTRCVLNGRLWVEFQGEVISEHNLVPLRHRYVTLPEHEDAFRKMGTRRKSTRKQFANLGPAAERFADGLDRTQGGASTYHMRQILKLVARIGRKRVVEALRYATRYDSFNHTAVARIVRAQRLHGATDAVRGILDERDGEQAPPRQDHEQVQGRQRPMSEYEPLLRDKARPKEDDPDGQ